MVETGLIIAYHRATCVNLDERIAATRSQLDMVVAAWQPGEIACGMPTPLQLPSQQATGELLAAAMEEWSSHHHLPLFPYHLRDIRAGILGRGTAAKEELAYVVMTRWGLLGQGKTTHEWNAIAVGEYHLRVCRGEPPANP